MAIPIARRLRTICERTTAVTRVGTNLGGGTAQARALLLRGYSMLASCANAPAREGSSPGEVVGLKPTPKAQPGGHERAND
jgi:hypothetical protein